VRRKLGPVNYFTGSDLFAAAISTSQRESGVMHYDTHHNVYRTMSGCNLIVAWIVSLSRERVEAIDGTPVIDIKPVLAEVRDF
jgi:hypothetical protein